MFSLLRLVIWLCGVAVVAYFVLGYFGYQVNLDYFKASKDSCQQELLKCQKELVKTGVEGAKEKCEFQCIDPKILIHKEQKEAN
jgi:hypothetical protein